MRQSTGLEFGDDLLDDRMVTVTLVGLSGGQVELVMKAWTIRREQLALFAAVTGQWLEAFDAAHDQPTLAVFGVASAGERGERNLVAV